MTRPTMPLEFPDETFATESPGAAPVFVLDDLSELDIAFDVTDRSRADHGRDWWPLSIGSVANARVDQWPSVVVHPSTTDQVSQVMEVASRHLIPVTAQGGRSGVVGGAAAPTGAIALDLTALDRILGVDQVSGTVTTEAGVFGPDLERHVRALGWTVGHFPQSFDLATVGGWIACRGAGQYSNRYGKIEDIVRSLTVVLANGEIIHVGGRAPRQAVGPDLLQLFVGSEGALGIITEATLAMHPVPETERRSAFLFPTFAEGLTACRRIMQRDARPAVLRLYDEIESQRNFAVDGCVLIVLDEGDDLLVGATMAIVGYECHSASPLDSALVEQWLAHRNNVDALAPLWQGGFVIDTIEVAGPWNILNDLYDQVTASLRAIPEMLMVSVHQSHAYLDGACLYFTFAGRPTGDATSFYRAAWDLATDIVLGLEGALSHHHGVGRNRSRFVRRALGPTFNILEGVKDLLDPHELLNPGVLGLGGEPW